MSSAETLYLLLVLSVFGGFAGWVGYCTWRYDQTQKRTTAGQSSSDTPSSAVSA